METTERCYCLEMFRKTNPDAQGECLKMKCGRYKIEQRRLAGQTGKPVSIKELSRRRKAQKLKEQAAMN